eukprot:TRINITY_DN59643_c0_g1_i1.p1 TRINITY_DN59643_c0_g1~~TRINITY_DN59643_c0_g1_i1.p1  ORF type:complete len:162 (+),score=40.54 TRINITY_DN59643_c0_g1_i1:47-532(+)
MWVGVIFFFFFFQAEDGIRDVERSRGLGDVYKRQGINAEYMGSIWSGGSLVEGIIIKYCFQAAPGGSPQYVEVSHKGSKCNIFSSVTTGNFTPGEYLSTIRGRHGAIIDRLELYNNYNKLVAWAGGSGGLNFDLQIPYGKRVIAFSGSTNGHLHSLTAYFI